MQSYLIFALACAVAALLYGVFSIQWVLAQPSGNDRMREIAAAIQQGAQAYLNRQYSTIAIVGILLFVVLGFALNWPTAIGFLVGALLSGLAGYTGMYISVRSNVRTAEAARGGINPALKIAFRGGAITGMLVVGLGLLGVVSYFWIADKLWGGDVALHALVGFAFGGSLISIFARLGGGSFTKGAGGGAALVGKVEAGIPEDDPRNPAVIADNVGDNVGDCAGMAADLFESYEVTLVASIILGVAGFTAIRANPALGLVFPLAARAIGVLASIAGVYAVKAKEGETDALKPINRGFLTAGIITVIGVGALGLVYVGDGVNGAGSATLSNVGLRCVGAVVIGLILA